MLKRLDSVALVLFTFIPSISQAAKVSDQDIFKALQSDKSTFAFNHRNEFSELGTIAADNKAFLIVYCEYNETARDVRLRGGNFPHASHRILVFAQVKDHLEFQGFYSVDKAPLGISGNAIRFEYPVGDGDKIVFDKNGPPKRARLDGEFREFGK